jgi:hypothetical protein
MRNPIEFTLDGTPYRASRMDVRTQMNVTRRITPLMVGLIEPMIEQVKLANKRREAISDATGGAEKGSLGLLDINIKALLPGVQATAQLLASMPDAEFDYVQAACLNLVERQRAGDTGWSRIWNPRAGQPQFDDIEGHTIFLIMAEVLKAELGPFFFGIVSSIAEGKPR